MSSLVYLNFFSLPSRSLIFITKQTPQNTIQSSLCWWLLPVEMSFWLSHEATSFSMCPLASGLIIFHLKYTVMWSLLIDYLTPVLTETIFHLVFHPCWPACQILNTSDEVFPFFKTQLNNHHSFTLIYHTCQWFPGSSLKRMYWL